MTYWLYEKLKIERPEIEPMFSLQSSVNWIKSLSFEINEEHGLTVLDQFNSCRNVFGTVSRRNGAVPLAPIFSPLFHSLTYTVSLISLAERNATGPWMFSSGVITWYYAVYNAFKSLLASLDGRETETHSLLIRSLNGQGLRRNLPHPFNVVATRTNGEDYAITFPHYPATNRVDIAQAFDNQRQTARGMIWTYLNGTAKWEVEKIKERLIAEGKALNFRTKVARDLRDRRLPAEINFMNCAFRYRGKANYRDSIFIAYGQDNNRLNPDYISNLMVVARFAFLCALAYAEKRVGRKSVQEFLDDLNLHFRGQNQATVAEKFWTGIVL